MLELKQIKRLCKPYTPLQLLKESVQIEWAKVDGEKYSGFVRSPEGHEPPFWTNGRFVSYDMPHEKWGKRFDWQDAPDALIARLSEIETAANIIPAYLVSLITAKYYTTDKKKETGDTEHHFVRVVANKETPIWWYDARQVRTFLTKVKESKEHPARFTIDPESGVLYIRNGRKVALVMPLAGKFDLLAVTFQITNVEGTPLEGQSIDLPMYKPEPEPAEETAIVVHYNPADGYDFDDEPTPEPDPVSEPKSPEQPEWAEKAGYTSYGDPVEDGINRLMLEKGLSLEDAVKEWNNTPEPEPTPETVSEPEPAPEPELEYEEWTKKRGRHFAKDADTGFVVYESALNKSFADAVKLEIPDKGAIGGIIASWGLVQIENALATGYETDPADWERAMAEFPKLRQEPYLGLWYTSGEEPGQKDIECATKLALTEGAVGAMIVTPEYAYFVPGEDDKNINGWPIFRARREE